ncbi:hypothetical protein G6F62_004138 [Rhizopus arrhizus]|nr:hypothetical protein G6F62_004138 [Rhizopus arrhizus]
MNLFENRVDSFNNKTAKWPHVQKNFHKPETFARAGLYFARRPKLEDSLRCFLCDIELSHWKQGQSPFTRHAHEAPHCPWVVLDFPDNPSHDLDVDHATSKGTRMRNARLATFTKHKYWPPKIKSKKWPLASKVVSAGFYFAPSKKHPAKIRCPYCHVEITDPIETNDLFGIHKDLNAKCVFLKHIKDDNNKESMVISDEIHDVSSKKDQKAVESLEDSIWDINQAYSSDLKSKKRKHLVTYSKRSSRKRRSTEDNHLLKKTVDQENTRQPRASEPVERPLKDKRRKILNEPPEAIVNNNFSINESSKEMNTSKVSYSKKPTSSKEMLTKQTDRISLDKLFNTSETNLSLENTASYLSSTSKGETSCAESRELKEVDNDHKDAQIIIPVRKDKGKGREIDYNTAPVLPLVKKNINLSKKRSTKVEEEPYVLINDPSSHHSIPSTHWSLPASLSGYTEMLPEDPKATENHTAQLNNRPNIEDPSIRDADQEEQTNSPVHQQQTDEEDKSLKSTPAQIPRVQANVSNVFEDYSCLSVQSKDDIDEAAHFFDGVISLTNAYPSNEKQLTEDQKKMTIEQLVLSLVEHNIEAIQKEGQEIVDQIKEEGKLKQQEILSRNMSL